MKIKYVIWLIAFILILALVENGPFTSITGLVVNDDIGCCQLTCQETVRDKCSSNFYPDEECNKLDQCNVGCCIDEEGYCLSNYLKGNCKNMFVQKSECNQFPYCIMARQRSSLLGSTGYPVVFRSYDEG